MGVEENKAIVRRIAEAGWNSGEFDALEALLAPDCVHPGEVVGNDAYTAGIAAVRAAFPDFRMELRDVIADGDWVGFHATSTGTHRGPFRGIAPTGRAIRVRGAALVRIVGGRMVEHRGVADMLGLLEQLGAAVAPPAR